MNPTSYPFKNTEHCSREKEVVVIQSVTIAAKKLCSLVPRPSVCIIQSSILGLKIKWGRPGNEANIHVCTFHIEVLWYFIQSTTQLSLVQWSSVEIILNSMHANPEIFVFTNLVSSSFRTWISSSFTSCGVNCCTVYVVKK